MGSVIENVIENVVRKFLNNYFTSDSCQSVARKDNCFYFKLPYIGPFSIMTQRRIKKLVNTFCSDLEIKLVFTPFKIRSWFGAKDPIPAGLRSRVIYKFSCAEGLDSSRDNDILRNNTTLFKFKNMFRQKLLPSSV